MAFFRPMAALRLLNPRAAGKLARPPEPPVIAALIFAATYLVIALGRAPGLRLDRAGAALLGASLMVATGALSLDEAYRAIDLDTITLLLGMMILVAHLRLAGFFALANAWIARHARHPLGLLAGVSLVSGGLSAFLVNDTVCLMLTPLVAELALSLRRNPVPYLLALAMASNIGSTATITGNPQNIMIGSFSHIAYGDFAGRWRRSAAAGLMAMVGAGGARLAARVLHPRPARGPSAGAALQPRAAGQGGRGRAGQVLFFFLGQPPAKVGDHRGRAAAADPPAQARARLSRDRLGAAAAVLRPLHRRRRHRRRRCSGRRCWPMPTGSISDRRR